MALRKTQTLKLGEFSKVLQTYGENEIDDNQPLFTMMSARGHD